MSWCSPVLVVRVLWPPCFLKVLLHSQGKGLWFWFRFRIFYQGIYDDAGWLLR
ncbi:hypothetical protein M758_5G091100 [Ceratodon purpureus]|nr:hypothetical protein M758_5G091100 [Ceratodon purpureus]